MNIYELIKAAKGCKDCKDLPLSRCGRENLLFEIGLSRSDIEISLVYSQTPKFSRRKRNIKMNRFTGLKTLFIIGAKFHEEKRDIKKSR